MHDKRRAPAERGAQAEADDRRQRVAEVAADTMHRIGDSRVASVDVRVQDREIGRMENAVADAHDAPPRETANAAPGASAAPSVPRDQQRHARQAAPDRAPTRSTGKPRCELRRRRSRHRTRPDERAQQRSNDTSNSARSSGKSGGSASWKKCDRLRAMPTEHDDAGIATGTSGRWWYPKQAGREGAGEEFTL